MLAADSSTRLYSERLSPSPAAWLIAPGVGLVFLIMFLPTSQAVAIGVGLATAALTAGWLWTLAARITLSSTHLTVGRARIELEALGEMEVCSPAEMTHYMGPGSDARSYVLTRPWVHGGVYVEQVDPRDPTPYWLFSSRFPQEFAQALTKARESS